jgi:sodium/hydrogen exchanger-like protein 6/7
LIANDIELTDMSDLPEYIHLRIGNHTQHVFVYAYKNPKRLNDVNSQEYEEKASFDPEIFFNLLLPPIIFNAGYSMKRVYFNFCFD